MITLMIAAAAAATQPVAPAMTDAHAQQVQPADHKGMDCCPCCKDMADKHEGRGSGHSADSSQ